MPPQLRIRPYKDFLTPALHRRFSSAAAVLLGLCYVESLLIGEWNSLIWSWFPFGRAGLRTGLLFIASFMIFILRVANLHVGKRTTPSPMSTFVQYAFRLETLFTALWYGVSAWFYSEVYIFSAPVSANIYWITEAKQYERPRLNERPVYLMTYFLSLAMVQTVVHLVYDEDRVTIPVQKEKNEASVHPLARLKTVAPSVFAVTLKRAVISAVVAPFVYSIFLRQLTWNWALGFARIFWRLPKSTTLPVVRPYHFFIVLRSFTGGFLLLLLWEGANVVFSTYVAQEPLKNERPITYESKDPDGSLLTGLNGNKLQTRVFAFWELAYIAQRFEGRRKKMFEDIDRAGGSTWSQIRDTCLKTVNGINERITEYETPTPPPPANSAPVQTLPRISSPPLQENVFKASPNPTTRRGAAAEAIGKLAKTGQSPGGAKAPKLLEQAKATLISPPSNSPPFESLTGQAKQYALQFLASPAGWPLRHAYRRRATAVLLGTPYGELSVLVDAVDALTRLAVCSLAEDRYGKVQGDVPAIIRVFTQTVARIECFRAALPSHWTDVEGERASPEADALLEALRRGLAQLLGSFEVFSKDLKIGMLELREAREAAKMGKAEEMRESRS